MSEIFTETIIISVLAATVRIATPLIFAALGELITERAGILNLGVEGTMLMSAFAGFVGTFASGSIWLGLLVAMLAGGLMALITVFMATTLKVKQVVTGLSLYLYMAYFADNKLPTIEVFQITAIPCYRISLSSARSCSNRRSLPTSLFWPCRRSGSFSIERNTASKSEVWAKIRK